MKLRSLLLTGALALSSISLLSAKSYDIILSSPAQAGSLHLAAGEYTVKVQGTNAVFTKVDSGKKVTAPVKVEKTGKKFDYTAVESTNVNGTEQVKGIELGGSTTLLQFTE
jgi:hypothetical protein